MSDKGFVWRRRVGFGDCDPAMIAYTGRIPEFALEAIDAFWEDLLDGESWYRMVVDSGLGTPFVHMSYDFAAPITPRHSLVMRVRPKTLGKTSIRFAMTASQNEQECFTAEFVCVFVSASDFRKIEAPERIRVALEAAYPELAREAAQG